MRLSAGSPIYAGISSVPHTHTRAHNFAAVNDVISGFRQRNFINFIAIEILILLRALTVGCRLLPTPNGQTYKMAITAYIIINFVSITTRGCKHADSPSHDYMENSFVSDRIATELVDSL